MWSTDICQKILALKSISARVDICHVSESEEKSDETWETENHYETPADITGKLPDGAKTS